MKFGMLKSLTAINFLNLISVDRSSQNINMSESLLIEMGIMDIIKFTDSMVGGYMIESPFRGDFQTIPFEDDSQTFLLI